MPDVVTVDNGALTDYPVATDTRTIGGQSVEVQRVGEIGSVNIATSQVAVTTTAATLVALRDTRKRVLIRNNANRDIWVGPATVTVNNGFRVYVNQALVLYTIALIQAITDGTMVGDIDIIEEYD